MAKKSIKRKPIIESPTIEGLLKNSIANTPWQYKTGVPVPFVEQKPYGQELNDDILLRQIYAESTFNPTAVSKAGYKGLGQIGKTVIDEYKKATGVENVDPFNINDNLAVQKWAMNNLYNASFINKPDQDPEIRLAKTLAAYNWGRGNLSDYLNEQKNNGIDIYNSKDWINGLPKETKDYIEKILYKSNDQFNDEFKKAIENDKYKNIIGKFNYNPNQVVIDDNMGQWKYPGEVTRIASNDITMKGVPYPVLGIGADGEQRMMYPNQEYTFNQAPVTEYPMMQAKKGGWLTQYQKAGPVMPADVLMDPKKMAQWMKDHPEATVANANKRVIKDPRAVSVDPRLIKYNPPPRAQETVDYLESDPRNQSYTGNPSTSLLWNPNQVQGEGARALEAGMSVPIDLATGTAVAATIAPPVFAAMEAPIAGGPAWLTGNNILTAAMIPSGAKALSFLPADVQSGNLSGFGEHALEAGLDLLPLGIGALREASTLREASPFVRNTTLRAASRSGPREGLLPPPPVELNPIIDNVEGPTPSIYTDIASSIYDDIIKDYDMSNITFELKNIDNATNPIFKNTSETVPSYIKSKLSARPLDYSKELTDEQYADWAKTLFRYDADKIPLDELRNAHKESIKLFKNTAAGGKEHGLYIKDRLADKLPNFNSVKLDSKGNVIHIDAIGNDMSPNTQPLTITENGYDITKMTPQERSLMEAYAHGYDSSINGVLRSPNEAPVSQFYQEMGEKLNQGILKNKFKKPTLVRRGVQSDYDVKLVDPVTHEPTGKTKLRSELTTGDVFIDDSFISSSSDIGFSWGQPHLGEIIEIPGGGVQSVGIPEAANFTKFRGERETLLPKGLVREVIGHDLHDFSIEATKNNPWYNPVARLRTKILNPYILPYAIPAAGAAATPTILKNYQGLQQQQNGGWLSDLYTTLNPNNWGVEDYSSYGTRSAAYRAAKKAGKDEFMFNGKRFTTEYAGTPLQEVGAYGIKGKPVQTEEMPAQVNLYSPFSNGYIPGHVSASISPNMGTWSVNYSSKGNDFYNYNNGDDDSKKYFVYGVDPIKFSTVASSLPSGDYPGGNHEASTWNLFTNNCADNVCDAFDIPRSSLIQTPAGAVEKISKKYPTIEVTGRTLDNYRNYLANISELPAKDILSQADKLIGLSYSPEFKSNYLNKTAIIQLQKALYKEGYELPKSAVVGNGNVTFDGIYGPETKAALEDWQTKKHHYPKKKDGGWLSEYQTGGETFDYYTLPNGKKVRVENTNEGVSHYDPVTQTISFNPNDDPSNPEAVLQHEGLHAWQDEEGQMHINTPNSYGPLKRPNIVQNGSFDEVLNYFNRRPLDEEYKTNQVLQRDPEFQFIPGDLLYNGHGAFPGVNELMYRDPRTVEGQARDYEYAFRRGEVKNPVIINEYQNGGEFHHIKNNLFNRTFRDRRLMKQEILDENPALQQVMSLDNMNIDYARGQQRRLLEELHHNPEYFDKDNNRNGVLDNQNDTDEGEPYSGDITMEEGVVKNPHPGEFTTLINKRGMSRQQIKEAAANDFISHSLHYLPEYQNYSKKLNDALLSKIPNEHIENEGGVDAYMRSLFTDSPDYASYIKDMNDAGIDPKLLDEIRSYVKGTPKHKRGGVTWLNEYQNGTNNVMPADVMTDPKKLVEWMKDHPEAHINTTPASIAPERTTPWTVSDNTNTVIATPKGSVNIGTRNAPNISVPGGGISKNTVKDIEIVLDLAEFYPPTAVAAYIAGVPFTIMDLYDDYKKGSQPAEYVLDALGLIPGEKLGSKAANELLNIVNFGVDVKDYPEKKYGGVTYFNEYQDGGPTTSGTTTVSNANFNVNDLIITNDELKEQAGIYLKRMEECKKNGAGCLEQANRYYDRFVSPVLPGSLNHWQMYEHAGIPSGKGNPRASQYGETADSWDIHGLLQEKGAKKVYAAPLSNVQELQNKLKALSPTDQENYWINLNLPVGTIVGMGSSGLSHEGLSYNNKKGLVASNHSAIIVGYNEKGLPVLYDYGMITPITQPKFGSTFPITNITVPKENQNYTFDYVKKNTKSSNYTPVNFKVPKDIYDIVDPDEFDPFVYALENYKPLYANALGLSDQEYDELAKQAIAIALTETKGGNDASNWRYGVVPSYLTDKMGLGDSQGITQFTTTHLKNPDFARVMAKFPLKPNATFDSGSITYDEFDPWNSYQIAAATLALLKSNINPSKRNLKTPGNKQDMPAPMLAYYQYNTAKTLRKGEAEGNNANVKRFWDYYNKVNTIKPPVTTEKKQYGGPITNPKISEKLKRVQSLRK